MIDFGKLAAPFPPERISWRVGSSNKKKVQRETGNQNAKATKGTALAYIDARDVMERLDDVCGPAGWQRRYPHAGAKTVCEIGIKVGEEWVWKGDGAGDSDIEAEKGALSDAFKRAGVSWGIGRYLYGMSSPWVELDEWEKITPDSLAKLEALLKTHTDNIEWGDSEDRATLKAMSNGIKTMLQTVDDVRRYREENAGVLAQLRVKAREHINQILDKIEEAAVNQAA